MDAQTAVRGRHSGGQHVPGAYVSPSRWITETLADSFVQVIAIDVEDVALLHVAAALDADTKSARLQVWGRHAAWNDFLAIMRRLWPGRKFIDDLPDTAYLGASTDQSQSLALLKKWGGRDDWKPLDESVRDTIVTVK